MAVWKRLNDISESDRHAQVSFEAVGLWVYILGATDSCGRRSAETKILANKVLTLRAKVTDEWIDARLAELASIGLIHLYVVDGRRYLVLHRVSKYNPPGAIGKIQPEYPAPDEGLCDCLVFHEKDREKKRRDSGAIAPPVYVPSSSPSSSVLEGVESEKGGQPTLKSGSIAALLAGAYCRMNPAIIGIDKATKLVEFALARGANAQALEVAFNDPSCKGRLIWEILKEHTPENGATKTFQDEMAKWIKERADAGR